MRYVLVFMLLSACSSASLGFQQLTPDHIVVEGSTFDVFRRDLAVQAIRLDFEALPNKAVLVARAVAAIELATGCRVDRRTLAGDQALVNAMIICP